MKSSLAIPFAVLLFSTVRAEDRSLQGRDAVLDAVQAHMALIKKCALEKVPPLISTMGAPLLQTLGPLLGCGLPGSPTMLEPVQKCILTKLPEVLSSPDHMLLMSVASLLAGYQDIKGCVTSQIHDDVCTILRNAVSGATVMGQTIGRLVLFCP
ncbi:uncharacterized protein LOC116161010 [Photinus pyralis]|uniref:uncharacterized protein LOC116161010 n=1 Tax=Photinus pyralis TaxID=7054 RepID=UPI001267352E|nr:uncharacterized protein LOC116161010 [Photinus pyralis]